MSSSIFGNPSPSATNVWTGTNTFATPLTVGTVSGTGTGAFYAGTYYTGTTPGIDGTITTANLVGKTVTFSKGIITSVA